MSFCSYPLVFNDFPDVDGCLGILSEVPLLLEKEALSAVPTEIWAHIHTHINIKYIEDAEKPKKLKATLHPKCQTVSVTKCIIHFIQVWSLQAVSVWYSSKAFDYYFNYMKKVCSNKHFKSEPSICEVQHFVKVYTLTRLSGVLSGGTTWCGLF